MKIKNAVMALAVAFLGTFALSSPVSAVTCPQGSVRGDAPTLGECNLPEDNSLVSSITVIINIVIGMLGIIAVAVVVLGGVQYTTSAGDPGKAKKAKDTIMYGVIGLVVAILAYSIVNFVLSSVLKNQPSGGGSGGNPNSSQSTTVNSGSGGGSSNT